MTSEGVRDESATSVCVCVTVTEAEVQKERKAGEIREEAFLF